MTESVKDVDETYNLASSLVKVIYLKIYSFMIETMSRLEHLCLIQSCFVEVETNKLRSEDIEALEVYALNSTILYFQVKHLLHFNSCRLMHFNIGFSRFRSVSEGEPH